MTSTREPEIKASIPSNTKIIQVGEKTIYLLGTAHVSKESVEDVEKLVGLVQPDTICVELCQGRYDSYKNPDSWKRTNLFEIVKKGKSFLLLVQLILGAFYKKIGEELEVRPGAEMFKGIELAEDLEISLVLADRDVQVTLKRLWGFLSFWSKLKLFFHILTGIFEDEEISEDKIEEMKKLDQVGALMEMFNKNLPDIKKRLIDERDVFLAQKIRESEGKIIVAIVGAGHVPGISTEIQEEKDISSLCELPPQNGLGTILKWTLPLIFIGLLIAGFFQGPEKSKESLEIWFLFNGGFSALGALLALAHPLTILACFLAAPITSLNPMIAAGWVGGLVQAWIQKPTVSDFDELLIAFDSFKAFWMNKVVRVLLVVALANLGSTIASFWAASLISKNLAS